MGNMAFANRASAPLAAGIGTGATSLTVAAGKGALFPVATGTRYFGAVIQKGVLDTDVREYVYCQRAAGSDTITLQRAQDGSAAQTFVAGDVIARVLLASELDEFVQRDASVQMTGPLAMGGYKITGLAASSANGDAVRHEQLALKANVASPAFTGGAAFDTGAGIIRFQTDGQVKLPKGIYINNDYAQGFLVSGNLAAVQFTAGGGTKLEQDLSNGNFSYYLNGTLRIRVEGASGNFLVTGGAYKPGGGSWADTSDVRTKERIVDYEEGLAEIVALRPRVYSFRAETGRDPADRYVGLIAQEAEAVMPGIVSSSHRGLGNLEFTDMRSVDPSNLIYALINAVRTLHARVKALESSE